jgi:hypothetical protein
MPSTMRWIPKGMSVRYLRKARGPMTATARIAPWVDGIDAHEANARVAVTNAAGEAVFEADIAMWVSPRKD